jgi:hypothetical protein
MTCKHIRSDYTCKAFPFGIHEDVVNGFDHSFSIKGDSGVTWEKREPNDPLPIFVDISMQEAQP